MARAEAAARERSVGELFGELASETSSLVRQEVTLATTELAQKATMAVEKSLLIVGAVLFAGVSLLALAGALVVVLAGWVPLWASALIVSAMFGAIASGVSLAGIRALQKLDLRPTETLASIKDTKSWATRQLH